MMIYISATRGYPKDLLPTRVVVINGVSFVEIKKPEDIFDMVEICGHPIIVSEEGLEIYNDYRE